MPKRSAEAAPKQQPTRVSKRHQAGQAAGGQAGAAPPAKAAKAKVASEWPDSSVTGQTLPVL